MNKILRTIILIFFVTTVLSAQSFEDNIKMYTSENGKGYLQPLSDALGANLNSGWYRSAKISTGGLNIYVGVIAMGAVIGDDARTFTAVSDDDVITGSVTSPTIFGDSKGASIPGPGGTQLDFPGGMDIQQFPILVPQLTIGSIAGTDVSIRYVSLPTGDNFGDLKLLGFGARHSVSQYLPLLPINLAAGVYYQKLELGNLVEAKALFFSAQASLSLGIAEVYGGMGIESSSLDINYENTTTSENISLELSAENSVKITLGASVSLAILKLNAEYNLGSINVVSVGVGFDF